MAAAYCSGTAKPTVSVMLIVVAPASIAFSTTSERKSSSVRAASSGENSTSWQNVFARCTPATARRMISSFAIFSLNSR